MGFYQAQFQLKADQTPPLNILRGGSYNIKRIYGRFEIQIEVFIEIVFNLTQRRGGAKKKETLFFVFNLSS